jgi:hypothetical protein
VSYSLVTKTSEMSQVANVRVQLCRCVIRTSCCACQGSLETHTCARYCDGRESIHETLIGISCNNFAIPDACRTLAAEGGSGSLVRGIENVADVFGRSQINNRRVGHEHTIIESGFKDRPEDRLRR